MGLAFLGVVWVGCWWFAAQWDILRPETGLFYALFGLSFGLYLLALLWIGRCERLKRRSFEAPLLLGWVLLTAAAARLLVLGTTPVLSGDVYRYRWDGRVQSAGIDPYRFPPDAPELAFLRDEEHRLIRFPQLRTVYPPLAQAAFRIGDGLGGTVFAQKALFVASELLMVGALLLLLRRRGLSPLWLAAYLWHPLVLLEIAGSGHNDALGAGLLFLGVAAWERGRWRSAAVAWSAAFLSKFVSVLLVPWWGFRRTARRELWLFLLLALVPMMLPPTAVSALIESFSAMAGRTGFNTSAFAAVLAGLTGSLAMSRWMAVVGLAGFLLWWARRCEDPVRYLGGALAAAALAAPVLHPWYLVWLIPCFCFWRAPWLVALTGTAAFSYSVWPERQWIQYGPVLGLGLWEIRQWMWRSSYRLAMKPAPSAGS